MAHLVEGTNLSQAWIEAIATLAELPGGKAVNFNVSFSAEAAEIPEVTAAIDNLLTTRQLSSEGEILTVETVANTIFPQALYHPHLGDQAAPLLYENYALSMRMHRRRKRGKDTYFNRITAYPVTPDPTKPRDLELASDGTLNQLDLHVGRLRTQMTSTRLSSSYEIGVSDPTDAELRVQVPLKDKGMRGFPCLSHISITLADGAVNLTATYRNETFITRAYGNYLGLARLLRFIANETGARAGEIQVTATHADAELKPVGQAAVRGLVANARAALAGSMVLAHD